ncbi:MAG: hypothetical protein ABIQ12_01525 [Opitutaceae bacterium]
MGDPMDEFERLAGAIITRFAGQKMRPIPAAQISRVARQLGSLVAERGLPSPLAEGECGAPGGMAEEICGPLVARVIEGTDDPLLADAARQLVKACFYPEFTECRDSFREVAADGTCRRQELARAIGRMSGAHCVDCPHWVALAPAEHRDFLLREWRGDCTVLAEHRGVFLPEDFRALRHWLHAAARRD